MSDPFRSDLEGALEKLRRAEEQLSMLRSDKKALEDRVPYIERPFGVAMSALMIAAVGACIAWAIVGIPAQKREAKLQATVQAEAAQVDTMQKQNDILRQSSDAQLASCKDQLDGAHQREQALTLLLPPGSHETPQTAAARGLCDCPQDGGACACPFDRAAASQALRNAPVHKCWASATSIHVSVTFQPSGGVSSALVDVPTALTDAEQLCVSNTLHGITVPAFAGGQVTVGKSYMAK